MTAPRLALLEAEYELRASGVWHRPNGARRFHRFSSAGAPAAAVVAGLLAREQRQATHDRLRVEERERLLDAARMTARAWAEERVP